MDELEKQNIEDIFALTPMQEGMLYHYLKSPRNDQYFEQLSLGITGKVDVELFERAWDFVIETNDMMRTVFRWEKLEKPVQITLKEHKFKLAYYDFSGKDVDKKQKCLEKIKAKDRKKQFNLREVSFRLKLCKVEEKNYEMIISNHHILYDGWSNGIILEEFFNAYNDLSSGRKLVKPVKTEYKGFVKWMHEREIDEQEKFWRNYLQGVDTQTRLSIKKKKGKEEPITGTETYQMRLEKETKTKLEDFVKKHKITLASFLYSAWGLLLQKYNNTNDVIFGTTVSGRVANVHGIEDIVGLFINTIPIRVRTFSGEKIKDLLYRIDNALKMRGEYEQTALVNIKEYSEIEHQEELFDSIVVIENYPLDRWLRLRNSKSSLYVDTYSMVEMTHYDFTVGITVFDGIEFIFTYNKEAFNDDSVVRMANHFRCILQRMIENPGKMVSEIEIISRQEKREILNKFNSTYNDYPKDKTIVQLFAEQVEKTPAHVALVGKEEGRKGGRVEDKKEGMHLSYWELNQRCDQLAQLLKERDIKPDTIVGIMIGQSVEMIVGILGILKANGAYLPIDPQYPEEQKQYMLDDSDAGVLITTPDLSGKHEKLKIVNCQWQISCTSAGKKDHLHLSPAPATSLAYIIYTSGSTGKPKGVMVEHRSVVNYICWAIKRYININDGNVYFPLFTSISFDLTVTSLFLPLLSGNTIIIYESTLIDKIFEENRVEVIKLTPSHLRLLEIGIGIGIRETGEKIKSNIKRFIVGGEQLETRLAEKIVNKFDRVPEIFNEYGPTEATVGCMVHQFTLGTDTGDSVPIGTPADNVQIYLLDRNKKNLPTGVVGEVYIAGHGVARGYLNRVELTAEQFVVIDHPPLEEVDEAFANKHCSMTRLYKTGDLARRLVDENIEFLGRRDDQIKIRGFRIELGAIENQLLKHKAIREAVVLAKDDQGGDKYLVAYYVSDVELSISEIRELREYLFNVLPGYMVPCYFVFLEKFPLTCHGKVDRKSLPESLPGGVPGNYAAPRDNMEKRLVDIWSGVLGIERENIGINDNFFHLGGHSLKATVLVSMIYKQLAVKVPLTEIFIKPTIRGLAEFVKNAERDKFFSIEAVEKKEYYSLSSGQRRLFILQQMDEKGIGYNMPSVWQLEGDLDGEKFESVFHQLFQRHESLRTSFIVLNDEPVQQVHEGTAIAHWSLGIGEAEKREIKDIIKNFIKPFDLTQAPLLRVDLMKRVEQKNILMVDMHHIIADGMSVAIFVKEFMELYAGKRLPGLKLQYKDYSEWNNRHTPGKPIRQQEAYWLKEFAGEIPVLNLPTDYPRPLVQSFEGNSVNFEIPGQETRGLNAVAYVVRLIRPLIPTQSSTYHTIKRD
ncbi:MAG: amino acid adenylation domain-containing protein [Candidatus Aminicenantes bacterium]